jgi:uncharacterized protein YjiS (DUF1127 family)
MTRTITTTPHSAPRAGILGTIMGAMQFWHQRHRGRATLARLDHHLLHDIGLGPEEARAEVSKPFWRD